MGSSFLPFFCKMNPSWVLVGLLYLAPSTRGDCPIINSLRGYNFQGLSILDAAVIVNATDDIEGLVARGCDPNYDGTYLTYTATKCSSPLLENLGVNCTREVKEEGFTPLIIGVLVGSSDVVKKLVSLPNIDLDTKAEGVGPAVYDAARRGKLEMVKAMKEAGADMNNVGGSNEIPPLSIAIAAGHNEVARYLINQAKVDVNIEGKDGASPVFHAAQVGNFEMLKLLKKAGANLDTVGGPNKVSAVAIASETGFLKLVDYFISEGVDINRQGLDGDTPVYLAASRGHLD